LTLLSIVAAAVAVGWVLLYYLRAANVIRRPEFARALAGPLRRFRPTTLGLAAAVGLGASTAGGSAALIGGIATAAALFALLRQGVRRRSAAATPARPDEWGVELPGGDVLSLDALFDDRVVRVGSTVVVGCVLARSVAAFEVEGDVFAGLPLDVGFEIEIEGAGRWSGVDGRSESGDLTAVPLRLRAPGNDLAPAENRRRVRVPGASDGRDDDHRMGVVRDGRWAPLDGEPATLHSARWAARLRGELD
jgi:hypothetical protein